MKKSILIFLGIFICLLAVQPARSQGKLKLVIIRHGEKDVKSDNLNCMGLNRSLKLIKVLHQKIGVPDYTYIPSVGNGSATTHSRMFQTITPFAVSYDLSINSKFKGDDFEGLTESLDKKKGTVLFVWNHENIAALAKALGIKDKKLKWNDDDFDSIWIITGKGKSRVLTIDKEGIMPGKACASY